ncbi:hypothetical protein EPIR_2041 [Erwinia piriflorinigrans CFBP 5888]|uniref:Uncharacterized protein n=1 Tax=Erwinia piriflorinigrans CFBP 5888 TaxID=1161919 RepID=V5Z8Q4_9GAMM|nr:hypothetical protein EPIR_2041 [Erwinia piriflorinigrans CFBP 5888]
MTKRQFLSLYERFFLVEMSKFDELNSFLFK